MGWEMVKLGDVAEVVTKKVPGENLDPATPYFGLEHLKTGGGILGNSRADAFSLKGGKPVFESGDILFGRLRPNLRKAAIASAPGTCSGDITILRMINGDDTHYLLHFLLSGFAFAQIKRHLNGINLPRINNRDLLEIKVPLPPLEEQQRIATILGTVDTTLTRVEKKLSLLQELELNLAASSNDNVRQVSEIFAIGSGTVDPRDPELQHLALVGPENIEKDTGRPINVPTVADVKPISGKYKFEKGDVLYSKIRPNLNKVTVAQTEGLCSADMYVLRPRINLSPEALSAILRLPFFVELAVRSSGRANIPKINRKALSQLQVPLPAESQFEMFGRKIKELNEALSKTYQLHGYLTELYASLSSRAFAGEL